VMMNPGPSAGETRRKRRATGTATVTIEVEEAIATAAALEMTSSQHPGITAARTGRMNAHVAVGMRMLDMRIGDINPILITQAGGTETTHPATADEADGTTTAEAGATGRKTGLAIGTVTVIGMTPIGTDDVATAIAMGGVMIPIKNMTAVIKTGIGIGIGRARRRERDSTLIRVRLESIRRRRRSSMRTISR
jgi:hypothetical protein